MRLGPREKDQGILNELFEISNKSFDGIERPPLETFMAHFNADDVFVDDSLTPYGFAIVTERGGPYIWSIAVLSRLRRTGVASHLLEEIKDFYTLGGEPEIKLTCKVENWTAQIMYLKAGYRAVRVVPRYYGREDGLLMRRFL